MLKGVIVFGMTFLAVSISRKFIVKLSNIVKYRIFSCSIIIATLIPLPFMFFRPKDYRNILMTLWILKRVGNFLGVTMEIRGIENINKSHGNVILMNHQTNYDCLAATYIWPLVGRSTLICKRELLYIPFLGLAFWLSGFIFINRSNRANSINALQQQANIIKKQKSKIIIFPEGTRSVKEKLLPFKKGPFYMALEAKCAIQPVVISKCSFATNNEIIENKRVIIQVMPEICTEKYNNDSVDILIKLCHDQMQRKFDELNIESESKKLNF